MYPVIIIIFAVCFTFTTVHEHDTTVKTQRSLILPQQKILLTRAVTMIQIQGPVQMFLKKINSTEEGNVLYLNASQHIFFFSF